MKGWVLVILIIVLLIFLVKAWNKKEDCDNSDELIANNDILDNDQKRHIVHNILDSLADIDLKANVSTNVKEEICRQVFIKLFDKPFPSKRPSFLKNPETGRNLELDGYNEELKLAFEYNGQQHYDFPNTFHKTIEEFQRQVNRDQFKKQRCAENGVKLITIPYTVDKGDIENFILAKLGGKEKISKITKKSNENNIVGTILENVSNFGQKTIGKLASSFISKI